MHTIRKTGSKWTVVFEHGINLTRVGEVSAGEPAQRSLAQFDKVEDAAALASYLNGGDGDRVLMSQAVWVEK